MKDIHFNLYQQAFKPSNEYNCKVTSGAENAKTGSAVPEKLSANKVDF